MTQIYNPGDAGQGTSCFFEDAQDLIADNCYQRGLVAAVESYDALGENPCAMMIADCSKYLAIVVSYDCTSHVVSCYAIETDGVYVYWRDKLEVANPSPFITIDDEDLTRSSVGIWRLDETEALISWLDYHTPYVQAVKFVNGTLQKAGEVLQLSDEKCLRATYASTKTVGLLPSNNHVRFVTVDYSSPNADYITTLFTDVTWDGEELTEYQKWYSRYGPFPYIYEEDYTCAVYQATPEDIIVLWNWYGFVYKFTQTESNRHMIAVKLSEHVITYGNMWIARTGPFDYICGGSRGKFAPELKRFRLEESYTNTDTGLKYYYVDELSTANYVDDDLVDEDGRSLVGFSSDAQMFVQEAIELIGQVLILDTTDTGVTYYSTYGVGESIGIDGPYRIMDTPFTGCAKELTERFSDTKYVLGVGWDPDNRLRAAVIPLV